MQYLEKAICPQCDQVLFYKWSQDGVNNSGNQIYNICPCGYELNDNDIIIKDCSKEYKRFKFGA